MSSRELVVLGTASQVPTRDRNHNGYVLRWPAHGPLSSTPAPDPTGPPAPPAEADDAQDATRGTDQRRKGRHGEVLLFDPGEGTQRQMLMAGVAAGELTRICVTHFHGDHCLGLPGVIQRLSLDKVAHPVVVHYPESGREYFARLRHASYFQETAELREEPLVEDGQHIATAAGTLVAHRLRHPVESYGYRLVEPDGRRLLPERLAAYSVHGPAIGELQRVGHVDVDGRRVRLEEVSEPRPGQRFAFVMDTALCDGVYALADGVDLLVIESTFLDRDSALARDHGHLTARQAATVAAQGGVRHLVLTHFSQRYQDPAEFEREARTVYDGELTVAADLDRVPVPRRR